MAESHLLYLSRADVEAAGITMAEVIEVVETGFREKGQGRVEMPPKPSVHPGPDRMLNAMPAYLPALQAVGMKWVAIYRENRSRGLPYISGLQIVNDAETGLPLAVMDCVSITAMRTGAATAVAARHLARPDSRRLGVLGAGVQGFSNLEALIELFPIEEVTAYDPDPDQLARYRQKVTQRWPGLRQRAAAAPEEAVRGMDLVVTAGPIVRPPHATIQAGWLAEGAFASLVDYDSYWSGEAFAEVDRFATDDIPQLEYYRSNLGYFRHIPPIHAEIGDLVVGRRPGRQSPTERTMTCNLGLAMEDVVTAPLIYRRARERGLGTWLPL